MFLADLKSLLEQVDDRLSDKAVLKVGGGSALLLLGVRGFAKDVDLLQRVPGGLWALLKDVEVQAGFPRRTFNSSLAGFFSAPTTVIAWCGRNLSVETPSVEDLVLHKADSPRCKDWEDVAKVCRILGWSSQDWSLRAPNSHPNLLVHLDFRLNS